MKFSKETEENESLFIHLIEPEFWSLLFEEI
jgi:hypothetical protein